MRGAIHVFEIENLSASVLVDDEGITTRGGSDFVEVVGHLVEPSTDEVRLAAQEGQSIDLAAQVPHGTDVDDASRIVVTTPEVFAGSYRVTSVQHLRRHLRVLARRITIEDG